MNAESRRILGFGLLGGAFGIALLMLVWLATSGAQAGGAVLGLLLLFVIAGPLAATGWYVLGRGRAERLEEQAFAGKRRVLESDRLFREELTTRLRELARVPGPRSEDLSRLAEATQRGVPDESAWYSTIQLADAQIGLLAQYDDLVWEQVRWLRDHPGQPADAVSQAVDQLGRAMEQRADLLVRGRPAPAVGPGMLLRADSSGQVSLALRLLAPGDAISRDGVDYLVDRVASSFAGSETWKLAHLAPSRGDAPEHWLSVSPGGLELAWLESINPPVPGANQIDLGADTLPLVDSGSLLVRVESAAGTAPGVLVRAWHYRHGDSVGLVEQWPDGAVVAYGGIAIQPRELEVWPATRAKEAATT